MDTIMSSTAGRRQFEQTAIAKLVAEGVPKYVADAFVMHGIPKSGRYASLRDHVCKMTYEKFFLERTAADFQDPMRVGRMVPHVVESRIPRFETMFQMTDLEAAKFAKAFPEFHVVARGKVQNQHAFYANKRYAETELLVTMVFADAAVSGFNPRSLIDLGGNDSWHVKRGREYVRCNNPVLSVRDVMRYKVREVFSGSVRADVSDQTFLQDPFRADYAIAVHSTYDISPKSLAYAMLRKGVKKFFGVINIIPGIEEKPAGVYEVDGVVMTVVRPPRGAHYVKCGFRHDPALEYQHKLAILRRYLYVCRRYDFVTEQGKAVSYTYRVHSVRGASLLYTIVEGDCGYESTDTVWTPSARKLYYISLRFLGIERMEVDAEFFDRLVLQAAGARNIDNYDIVSLFRYGKSLRQRVSINGIVLSSGYSQTPEQLVNVVIAAYVVAVAYRVESADYFKKATSQIVAFRGKGFLRDIFTIVGGAVVGVLLALPSLIARASGFDVLDNKLKALVAAGGSVTVEVDKPHAAQGAVFVPDMLVSTARRVSDNPVIVRESLTPLAPGGFDAQLVSTTVECDRVPVSFLSYALPRFDSVEMPRPTLRPLLYDFSSVRQGHYVRSEEYRDLVYAEARRRIVPVGFSSQPVVLHNGDRVYRKLDSSLVEAPGLSRSDIPFVPGSNVYVVFRGVGSHAIALEKPKSYDKGSCLRFLLFYERKVKIHELPTLEVDGDVDVGVTVHEMLVDEETGRMPVVAEETWQSVPEPNLKIVRFADEEEGRRFVHEAADRGEFFMSGALPTHPLPTPDGSEAGTVGSDVVTDYISPFGPDPDVSVSQPAVGVVADASGSSGGSVSSSDLNLGHNSLVEMVEICDRSRQVALATSRAVVDMAIAVARGDAPSSKWHSMAQGHPGGLRLVKIVEDDELWRDFFTGEEVAHMAVSDGDDVYDRLSRLPSPGVYVTSDVMLIYTGAGIKDSIQAVFTDKYMCEVTNMNGVAGSGKTHTIVNRARPGDVVLCETRAATMITARELASKPGWLGNVYTVDAFLLRRPVDRCAILWIDESYRLHAGKIYAVIKLLRPDKVYCFGDSKQIPVLPYIPGFEFSYHEFAYTSVQLKRDTWRMPADVCFALSRPDYYGFRVTTHNSILRSMHGPVQYDPGMFFSKPENVPLLVYTQSVKEDLKKAGVKYVMTIGEAQGSTFDETMVFRDSQLAKFLYYSFEQTLVALSRHRHKVTYVTADAVVRDNSRFAELLRYVAEKGDEFLYSSHLESGVRGVADVSAWRAREGHLSRRGSFSAVSVAGTDFSYDEVVRVTDWAQEVEDVVGL